MTQLQTCWHKIIARCWQILSAMTPGALEFEPAEGKNELPRPMGQCFTELGKFMGPEAEHGWWGGVNIKHTSHRRYNVDGYRATRPSSGVFIRSTCNGGRSLVHIAIPRAVFSPWASSYWQCSRLWGYFWTWNPPALFHPLTTVINPIGEESQGCASLFEALHTCSRYMCFSLGVIFLPPPWLSSCLHPCFVFVCT